MKEKADKFKEFINYDIWCMHPERDLPKSKFFLIRQVRTIVLAVRGFFDDNCMLRASALTFYTLMSIVPVFALAFGFAKGFGYDEVLRNELISNFQAYEKVVNRILQFSDRMLNNTKGGLIAGVGVFVLLWTVIKLLGNIETAFNGIWGVKKGRVFVRKVVDYVVILFIATIFLVIASSANVYVTSFLGQYTETLFDPLIYIVLKFIPFLLIWFVFFFIYMVIPNVKVSVKAAFISGIIAGTIFQIIQGLYIGLQFGMTKYNAIYGSFAALPLFLMWLELSWMIVLFGAELAYANQNVSTYDYEPEAKNASIYMKRLVSLYIVTMVCKNFDKCLAPLSEENLSNDLDIPPSLVRTVLYDLIKCNILIKVLKNDNDDLIVYMPAINTDKLSVKYVCDKLDKFGSNSIPMKDSPELSKVKKYLKDFDEESLKSGANILLKDI
jgi:membrane protein